MRNVTVFPSAARTATANSDDMFFGTGYVGSIALFLDVTAASGTTPTLDVKLQAKKGDGTYFDIPGGTFAQKTAAGTESKNFPLVVAMAAASEPTTHVFRAVATIGGTTPSFTFSLTGYLAAE